MKVIYRMLPFILLVMVACSKNDNAPDQVLNEEELMDKIEKLFPFTPNQNFEALYYCVRQNSVLDWYFLFYEDGTLNVLFTTDTHQDFSFLGSYTYINNQINIRMDAGPTMPFPNGLNETSILIMPQFGLVAAFATPEMACVCEGHNLNDKAPPKVNANYDCPIINIQNTTNEENAIELVHRAVPFQFPVTGSVFRQQDTYVSGMVNPVIRIGYGIYRQYGNEFYATFRIAKDFADFSRNKLPYNIGIIYAPFEDYNILSGHISSDGQELSIDQLKPETGPCQLN